MNHKNTAGLALLELMGVLAIMAVVFCASIPLWTDLFKKNQSDIVVNQIKNAIQTAKIQALLRGEPIILSKLQGTDDWSKGMQLSTQETQQALQEWYWKPSISVEWQGFQSKTYLRFSPVLRENITNGQFIIRNVNQQIRLIVNRLGNVKINFQ